VNAKKCRRAAADRVTRPPAFFVLGKSERSSECIYEGLFCFALTRKAEKQDRDGSREQAPTVLEGLPHPAWGAVEDPRLERARGDRPPVRDRDRRRVTGLAGTWF